MDDILGVASLLQIDLTKKGITAEIKAKNMDGDYSNQVTLGTCSSIFHDIYNTNITKHYVLLLLYKGTNSIEFGRDWCSGIDFLF